MSIIESILNARKANINDYKRISRLFSDYTEENKTIKDYNGRQILELLQNADDESSTEVEILFDTSSKLLKVSNIGTPFSEKGFESLLLPNNSPKKSKKKYIGNKGLGFRSILNWAEYVEIISNGCDVQFSRDIATKVIEEELPDYLEEIQKHKEESGDKPDAFRYPILSLPLIKEYRGDSKWSTEIRIHYFEEYENDIRGQLKYLSEEVLLFVRHINKITINDNGSVRVLSSIPEEKDEYTEYVIDELHEGESCTKIYHVYTQRDVFPADYQKENDKIEPLFYEIAVAVDADRNFSKDENYLYSFFRTDIKIPLPCIIHGTFELSSSRNTCIVDKKNDYIWEKIAELLLKVSKKLQAQNQPADWKSYELLALNGPCSYLDSYLNKFLLEEPLYPCYDDMYRKADESMFYSEEFSLEIGKRYSNFFPLMVKYYEKPISKDLQSKFKVYDKNSFSSIWREIAQSPEMTNDKKIDLICMLSRLSNFEIYPKLPLLIDKRGNVIDERTDVYTPVLLSIPPAVPDFMNVEFLNKDMYEKLVSRLVSDNEANKPRTLCEKISGFVNILEYDISNLTPKIITKCNKLAQESNNPDYIRKTIQALYKNYINSSRDQSNAGARYLSILLVARDGSFVTPSGLYFSETYDLGKLTESIYGKNLKESQYLIEKKFWELEDYEKIEDFFEMLGVEKSIKCTQRYLSNADYEYYDAELRKIQCESYERYGRRPEDSVNQIADVSLLNGLTSSQILALISNSDQICQLLTSTTWLHFWQRGAKGQYSENVDRPYIAFQLRDVFSSVVIDNEDSDIDSLIDDQFKIDYTFLERCGVSRSRANVLLERLGACNKLDDYESELLYTLLRKIPEKYPDGKRVQKIYGLIYDILKKREEVKVPNGLILACKIGDSIEYKPSNEIYYYDDAILPQSALRKMPILLFRQRAGVSAVTRLFNVKRLDADLLSVVEGSVKEYRLLTDIFAQNFSARKPYILAYRLRPIRSEKEKAEEASKIESLSIKLIESGKYVSQDNELDMDLYDFIVSEDIVYVKVPNISYEDLVRDQKFLDVCCEIFGIIFSLESTDMKIIFKSVLRNDPKVSRYDIISERGEEYLQDCLELLKMNETDESRFWNRILRTKDLEEYSYSSGLNLKTYISEKLNLKIPENYEKIDFADFKDEESYSFLKKICSELKIEPNVCLNSDGLTPYYQNRLQNLIYDNKKSFKSLLWKQLNDLPIEEEEERIQFADSIYKYEHCCKAIDLGTCRFALDADLLPLLKQYVYTTFGVNLDNENIPIYEEKNCYRDIVDEAELDDRLRRLAIFEGYEELFTKKAEELQRSKCENQESQEDDAGEKDPVPFTYISIAPRTPSNARESSYRGNSGRGQSGNHGDSSDESPIDNPSEGPSNVPENINELKGKAGKAAEKLVKKWLNENGFESDPKSSISGGIDSNDAEHCDFLYKKKNSSEWRFLEVKNYAGSTIILTRGEIDFIFKDDHKRKYDLALVKKGKVHPCIAPFAELDEESFMDQYGAKPIAYNVTLDIQEEEQH